MTDHDQIKQAWIKRSDIQNHQLNLAFLAENIVSFDDLKSAQLLLFSHVPKSAGTTLEYVLAKNFAMNRCLHINATDLNKAPNTVHLKKQSPQLICGHHPSHGLIYQLLAKQNICHITMLRDPIDRVLSYYNYIKGKKDHALHQKLGQLSLEQFIETTESPEISNGQARRFSGYLHHGTYKQESLFDSAKSNLKNNFSMVFTTEMFDHALMLLKQKLNINDIYYHRKNTSISYIKKSQLNSTEIALITKKNQADVLLHQWATDQFIKLRSKNLNKNDDLQFSKANNQWKMLNET